MPPREASVSTMLRADGVKRAREVGLDQLVPRILDLVLPILSAAQEDARRLRVRGQAVEAVLRGLDIADAHLVAARCDLLGGAGDLGQGLLAEPPDQLRVSFHRRRHGHAERSGVGEVLPGLAAHQVHVRPGGERRDLPEVDHVHLPILRRVDDREAAAADAGALRLHHVEREGGRHRRVHGVSAPAHHGSAGFRGERVGGRDHAAGRDGGEGEHQGEHPHGGAL